MQKHKGRLKFSFQTTFAVFDAPRFCLSPLLCLADRKKLKNGADRNFGYNQSIRIYLARVSPFAKILLSCRLIQQLFSNRNKS